MRAVAAARNGYGGAVLFRRVTGEGLVTVIKRVVARLALEEFTFYLRFFSLYAVHALDVDKAFPTG